MNILSDFHTSSYWYIEPSFVNAEAFKKFSLLLQPVSLQRKNRVTWVPNGRIAEDNYCGNFDLAFLDKDQQESVRSSNSYTESFSLGFESQADDKDLEATQIVTVGIF